jgi:hypothetical protein
MKLKNVLIAMYFLLYFSVHAFAGGDDIYLEMERNRQALENQENAYSGVSNQTSGQVQNISDEQAGSLENEPGVNSKIHSSDFDCLILDLKLGLRFGRDETNDYEQYSESADYLMVDIDAIWYFNNSVGFSIGAQFTTIDYIRRYDYSDLYKEGTELLFPKVGLNYRIGNFDGHIRIGLFKGFWYDIGIDYNINNFLLGFFVYGGEYIIKEEYYQCRIALSGLGFSVGYRLNLL